MKTDHRVLLWCVAAWMCCSVVNCYVKFFDSDGNALREEDILDNDRLVKDGRIKIWENSYEKPYHAHSMTNNVEHEYPNLRNVDVDGGTGGGDDGETGGDDEGTGGDDEGTGGGDDGETGGDDEGTGGDDEGTGGDDEGTGGGNDGNDDNVDDTKKKECKDTCGFETDTLQDDKVKCLHKEEPVQCECLNNDDGKIIFNYKKKECQICDCGSNSDRCSFDQDGEIKCSCKTKYLQKEGKCELCDCGSNSDGCSFDQDGEIKCSCKTKYLQKEGKCELCDCGSNSDGCSFDQDGEIKCSCQTKYLQKEGKCELCDCGSNSDGCSFDQDGEIKCSCKTKYLQKEGKCELCDCGSNSDGCSFDQDGEIKCSCKTKYLQKDGKCELCDCGSNSDGCSFGKDGSKKCLCKPKFLQKEGKCELCDCGSNSDGCSFSEDGAIKCSCKPKFLQKDGKCELCDCGSDSDGCSFGEDGAKKCLCKPKFVQKDGKCVSCYCGVNAEGCSLNNDGTKICKCKPKFAQKGGTCEDEACVKKCGDKEDVTCKQNEDNIECECTDKGKKFDSTLKECRHTCADDKNCTNGALCEGSQSMKFCECLAGTSGDSCEIINDCTTTGKYTNCTGGGRGNCTYDSVNEIAVCLCKDDRRLKDKTGYCAACNCGENSEDCKFVNDEKDCKCKSGYSTKEGQCEKCDCGPNSITCSFNGTKKICGCKEGFGDDGKTCQPCTCGENAKSCSFKDGKETCICKEKFALKDGKCEVCDCGEDSENCRYDSGKKICSCKRGFQDNNGICKECDCGANSTSCRFENGNRICTCTGKTAQNGDKCEECICGINTKPCKFENGEKKCDCKDKFAYKGEKCTECNCGDKSKGCTFKGENDKECHCEDEYGDKDGTCKEDQCIRKCGVPPNGHEEVDCKGDRYGKNEDITCGCFNENLKFDDSKKKCRETCDDDKCKNSAKCEKRGEHKFCKCLNNTDGNQCEILTECGKGQHLEKCTGDKGECTYNDANQKAYCKCKDNKIYDPKEGYCQDKCTKNEECSGNKICFKNYCTCEDGKKGENCEIATGCDDELKKKCESANAVCAFSKTAPKYAACVCKDGNLVYNEERNECVAKFCNEIGCKDSAKCQFDADTKTAYCKCSSGKYYNYNTETCTEPDKCLLRKTPCKENEVCQGGECKCRGEKKDDKCIINLCKDVACFEGATCDNKTGTCKCGEGKYFTGSGCKDLKCIKHPFDESCNCAPNMERNPESKKCVPKDSKPVCETNCGLGYCVEGKCSCIRGISKLQGDKCVLDKDQICASKQLTEDLSKCKCTGKYKNADDGITCDLVTCSEDNAKNDCKKIGATCKMAWKGDSIGYTCPCPAGYTKNEEKGICADSCSLYEKVLDCSLKNQVCYNSYSVPNREHVTCDCAPPFKTNTKNCDDIAAFVYLISGIPVMKSRYQMENGIDYVKLNSDLMLSLSQMYNENIFDSGYLHDYVEDGDVLKTSVWVRFNQNISGQLNRFKLQAQSFPNSTCQDCDTNLYVWPPYVVLKGNDFKDVKAESLSVCARALKNTLCGEEAECKDNKCSCPRGYRTLEHTIKIVSDKARILRCEKTNVADIDECALGTHTCPGNTTCSKIPGSYICNCKPGYWKSTQNDQKDCVDMCTPSPCDKGTCSMKKDKYNCNCQAGYTGSLCDEEDVNIAAAKKSTVVVGAVLGTILILFVLAALFFYIKKRKNSYSEDFMPAPRQDVASEMRERRPIRGVVNTSYE